MRYPRLAPWLLAALVVAVWMAGSRHFAAAAEPAEAFLQGLQDRGLDDMALAYLVEMQTSPLCPKEFKETIDYKAGVVLVAGARSIRAAGERVKQLDAARVRLEKFLAEHPDHDLVSNATTQLANVLVERGRMMVDDAGGPAKTADEKKKLLDEARELYDEAKKVFAKAERHYVELLKTMPTGLIDRKNVELIETRSRARADLVQSRLFLGTVVYETAMTYAADSPERKKLLSDAAEKYKELYDKYGTWLAGLYARMWEGRCYKEQGDYNKALQIFDELLAQVDEPAAFRQLKNKALILSLETCLLPAVKQYKPAVDNFSAWQESSNAGEPSSADGLAIKYLAGSAYLEYARTLDEKDAKRRESIAASRELLQFVARFSGDYQRAADAKLGDPLLGMKAEIEGEPADFSEAQQKGKAALDQMQAVETRDNLELSQGKNDNHQKNLDEIARSCDEAIKYFQMALTMPSEKTSVDDVNIVRYYLAYLYLTAEDEYRAAVLGEFLAVRYPQAAGARQGAKIAMAAYAKLYNRAKPASASQEFGSRHMTAMADYITKRWPESPESADAWMMLLRTAVVGGDLSAAGDILTKIPPGSSLGGEAEMMLGRAYWADYLRALRLDESARPAEEAMAKTLDEARRLLTSGIEHSAAAPVDAAKFASVLSLAQIHLRDGKADEAVKLLDDPKIGAHALLNKKHPAATQPGYDIETYKTTLRAYVAVRDLNKAEETMDVLEKTVAAGGDAEAAAKLTQIYIGLGRELEELLQALRKQSKTEQLQAVSEGFELFLNRISERKQGNTFNSLNWVAETFFGMGSGFDPGGATLPPEADKYYKKAADTYRIILKKCKDDESFAPRPDAVYGIKIRLAKCLLRQGQYETAMKYLLSVLVPRNTMIDAQVQAAHTYQAWAATPGNSNKYASAVRGGYRSKKTGENVVWGWLTISKMAAASDKHADIFHEARYNLALCQTELAATLSGQKKKDALRIAENSISRLEMLYPKMGGPQWRAKYDALLKRIETLQGKRAVGLPKPPGDKK